MKIDDWKLVVLMAGCLMFAGCDVEDRLRSLMYDEPESATPTGDSDEETRQQRTVEPGDSPAEATVIEVRQQMEPRFATLESAGDTHWFSLQPADGESKMVELSVEPQNDELDAVIHLEIRGDGDDPPIRYDVADAGEVEEIPMLAVPADELQRISVSGADSTTGEYRIDVRQRLTAATVAIEPNDYPHLATTLEVPGEVQGFYDRPRDRDVFFVPAESLRTGVYSLEIGAVPGLRQTLEIYGDDSLDSPMMQIPVSEDRPAVIPNLSLAAQSDEEGDGGGLYFVLSAGEGYDREHGYRLRLIEHPDQNRDEFTLEREPNNTSGSAQRVDFGEVVRGYFHTADDVDRFRFTIEGDEDDEESEADEEQLEAEEQEREYDEYAGQYVDDDGDDDSETGEDEESEPEQLVDPWEGVDEKEAPEYVVQARVRPLGDAHRLGMRWLPGDDSDEVARDFRADDEDEELVVCNRVVGPGEYDVEVRAVQTDAGFRPRSYDYEFEILNIAETPGLEIEPNDEPEQADRLPMGTSRTGFIDSEGDVDVFAFVVGPDEPWPADQTDEDDPEKSDEDSGGGGWEAPETEAVRVHLEGNPLDLGFELLDDEGGRVANVNESGPGSDEQLQIDLPHGLYYVAVSAESGAVCEPYGIEVATP